MLPWRKTSDGHRHFTELPRDDRPKCPCCGGPIKKPGLIVDIETNTVMFGERSWRVSPQLAVYTKVLLDAYPRAVGTPVMSDALHGSGHDEVFHLVALYACMLRKIVRQVGGDVVHVERRRYRLEMKK